MNVKLKNEQIKNILIKLIISKFKKIMEIQNSINLINVILKLEQII